jgi:tetratricopeptide (TPR) repeat protein
MVCVGVRMRRPKGAGPKISRGSASSPTICASNDTRRHEPDRAYSNRGTAYGKLGRNGRAIADESEAIKLEPSEPTYFDNRGLSYAEEGEYDRAIIDYNEAIRLSPRANFLTNRGNAYQAKGDLSRAIADYDRAIQLNPAFADAYNNRGAAFRGRAISTERSPLPASAAPSSHPPHRCSRPYRDRSDR